MKVLIAEDNAIFRQFLVKTLKKEGYDLTICQDGLEAWKAFQQPNKPRLALLDWLMPGMDGLEVCRKVRTLLKDPYVYIIMLTAKGGKEDIVTGLEAGADDYLIKPCDVTELKARLHAGKRILDLQTESQNKEAALRESNNELKKSHVLLLRQEKLASIGTLSAGVAHEILNPLNIISTTTQLLKMEELPGGVMESLDEIMRQVNRATAITDNLRMFAHQKKAEIKPVDFHSLFDKTASLIDHQLSLDNILVHRDFDPNLPLIDSDEDQLAQVFLNLLNNAKDAMKDREENSITIQTKVMDGRIEIRFSDNGPGIPENIIGRIFDPFFTTKDPGQGTGLGLAVMHTIIEGHGGTIRVESEEGKGTTFVISLPTEHSRE